ncbi:hypothetical protein [Algoriphagus sp. Y33]|uniref:hypothetical protein n=1 Tax=Algoriphagus sp. Y33 TaxID=2772483 RepID=UPI001784DFC6|nr:hypothetical protein [Algoriphagus sp. Y33]
MLFAAIMPPSVVMSLHLSPDPVIPVGGIETDAPYSAMPMVGAWPNTAYFIASVPTLNNGAINRQRNGTEMAGGLYAVRV